ncbi:hypothetical protein AC481_05405 [miscellaneous Crenarchaeota group archaeon SMTZ-80]|nr:MAG: hypothetical protein AC481_05405 [miscellaneous Crenarchaeota group archaeon SMTZ-80]
MSKNNQIKLLYQVLDKKNYIMTRDDLGRKRIITISAILPTFLRSMEELVDYRYEVVRNELVAFGGLLTKGLIDELIIIDGSKNERGSAEERLVMEMISSAYRSIPLFHDQVDLLNKFPTLRDRAKLGLYDLVVKVMHQFDPRINDAIKRYSIFSGGFPSGKGAGLWLAIGASFGDILAFFDSDIKSFEGWHVASIIDPIIKSFLDKRRRIEFVKAYYTRLAVNLDSPEKGFYRVGGRITRLFMKPILRVLANRKILVGLEKLNYPLSGEFSGTRNLIESLHFPTDYGVETGMLIEIWKNGWIKKISQADLQLFQHFPKSDRPIRNMVRQIVSLLLSELEGCFYPDDEIVNEYIIEAKNEVKLTWSIVDQIEKKLNQEAKRNLYKDIKSDMQRVRTYSKILKELISSKEKRLKVNKMPSWQEMIQNLNGKNFQSYIRRRSITYTVEILNKLGIINLD